MSSRHKLRENEAQMERGGSNPGASHSCLDAPPACKLHSDTTTIIVSSGDEGYSDGERPWRSGRPMPTSSHLNNALRPESKPKAKASPFDFDTLLARREVTPRLPIKEEDDHHLTGYHAATGTYRLSMSKGNNDIDPLPPTTKRSRMSVKEEDDHHLDRRSFVTRTPRPPRPSDELLKARRSSGILEHPFGDEDDDDDAGPIKPRRATPDLRVRDDRSKPLVQSPEKPLSVSTIGQQTAFRLYITFLACR